MNISKSTYEQLAAFAFGELGPRETAELEAAMAANPDAAGLARRLRTIRELAAADARAGRPSEEAIRRAKAIFEPAAKANRIEAFVARALGAVDAVIAELAFDSRLQPLAVRDIAATGQFQLSYELENADLDLRIEQRSSHEDAASGERHRVTGQYSADDPTREATISVVRTDAEDGDAAVITKTTCDARGCFTLELDRGSYVLLIKLPEGDVIVPEFILE